MWIEERKVLIQKVRLAKTTLAKVEKEVIRRSVRKMGSNEVNVERVEEKPREEVVREKRADEVEDGGPGVRVVVERLDVGRDGDEVKQCAGEVEGDIRAGGGGASTIPQVSSVSGCAQGGEPAALFDA